MSPNYKKNSVLIDEDEIYDPIAGDNQAGKDQDIIQSQSSAPEEKPEENDDEGIEVIAEGAMCQCTMGKKLGKMNVICQFKVYCNGGTKLVATTQEKTLMSLSFGSCTAKNNGPCLPSITWQNYYEDVQIIRSLKILTMDSKGICQTGGQIEFQTSGQSQTANTKDITGVDKESLKSDNPLLRAEDEPIEIPNSPEFEEMIRQMEELMKEEMKGPMVILETAADTARGKVDRNAGIVPVTYQVSKNNGVVKQPKDKICSFLAAKQGVLTWKVRDDKMKVIHEADGAGTISVRFPRYGRYVIEAYGGSSTVKDDTRVEDIESNSKKYFNTLIIEVAPNEIILEANKQKWYVGGKVEVKATKLFADCPPSMQGLKYQVAQNGVVVGTDKAELAPTDSGCTVTFKEKGNYVVTADRISGMEVSPTRGIVIENLRVVSVTANSEAKLKSFMGETVNVDAKLNFEEGDKEKIKWDIISPDGEKVNEGKPQPGDFQKPGTYKVYAYCANARSESVKAIVEINETRFLNINWVDGNNNPTELIGGKEKVYAHVSFEYAAGMEIGAELRVKGSDKVIENCGSVKMKTDKLIVSVGPLSETVCKSLQNNQQLYLYIKTKNGSAIKNKNAAPVSYPIIYSTAKDIINLKFYIDKECRLPAIIGAYGSTIYAKVVTRNLKQKEIRLKLIHDIDYAIDDTLGTFTTTLNDDGVGIFEIKVEDGWARKNGYWQKTIKYYGVISEVGGDAYKEELTLGKDAAAITFTDKPKNSEEGKVLTKIAKKGGISKNSCPKCKVFTEKDFKDLFPKVKTLFKDGDNQLKSTTIKAFADELNKAFEEFGIDNCNRKLHFFTQVACETGDFLRIDENLNYPGTSFRNSNWPKSRHPKLYEANAENIYVNKPEVLANYAYRNSGGNGDEASGDGYKYRGRGLIQLTYKNNYQLFENYLVEKDKIAKNTIIDNPDLLLSNLGYLVRSAAWFWKYGKSGNGTDRLDISKQADRGNISKITLWTHGNTSTIDKRVQRYEKLKSFYKLSLCDFYMNYLAKDYVIDYHIFSDGKFKKYIPKNANEAEIFQYRYYYHDENNTEHFVVETIAIQSKKYQKGSKSIPGGKYVTRKNNDKENIYFKLLEGTILLVRLPEGLDVRFGDIIVKYTDNTSRNFCDPQVYASLIGTLAECSYEEVVFNGCTCWEGIGDPSVSHAQGFNTDFRYIRTDKDTTARINISKSEWKDMNKERQNKFNKATKKFGWKERLSNTVNITLDEVKHDPYHGDHLHCQKHEIVVETKEKEK